MWPWLLLLLLSLAAMRSVCGVDVPVTSVRASGAIATSGPSNSLEVKSSIPSNCLEVKRSFPDNGIQTIVVAGHKIPVYCDQTTDGGGWTVIQRRQDGSINFNRDWTQYENGFGTLNGEFWLGLINMHLMTTSANYSLRIDLWDKDGTHIYAMYSSFYIAGASDTYKLNLGRYIHGTAGDSMLNSGHPANKMTFSTPDRDHDLSPSHCASTFGGGWWFRACHYSNLNGHYHADGRVDMSGITWFRYTDDWRSFVRAEMKIRPEG